MNKIIIFGDKTKLKGNVKIEGAKNSVLPILAASLLAEEGITTLKNVPILSDVFTMNQIIKHLNVDVNFYQDTNEITIDARKPLGIEVNCDYFSQMRASILIMGPLLARNGHAKAPMPGGCAIGKRPIDLHLNGFKALGAKIIQENGYIEAIADELVGKTIFLDFPSVGATQNIMMAAVRAKGTTIIQNVGREPEIVDLANILNKMGANINGAGTETMFIKGVKKLHAVTHAIIQDRIEAGTFMVAAAMTEGNVLINEAIYEHNRPLISKLSEMGAVIKVEEKGIRVIGPKHLKPTDVKTMPYPGFPTDIQAPMTAIQMFAEGTSIITETVFENRFQHLEEMRRMNADIKICGNIAVVNGGNKLQGAAVEATDLRAAAALILVGLRANGITCVSNLKYLDRGYYEFHKKLKKLGAHIERVNDDKIDKRTNNTGYCKKPTV